jgi:MFS family permease
MRLLLRRRAFGLLWCANLCSSTAGWALGIALAVHVFEVTASPLATSGLLVAGAAPAVVLGTVGGVVADRVDRTRLLQVVSWLRVVIVASLGLTGREDVWPLYVVVAVHASAMQFFAPAEQASVAALVLPSELPAAAGANSVSSNVTRLVAPAMGGALMGMVGFDSMVAVIGGMLAAAALLLLRLPTPEARPARARPSSFARDWQEAFVELRANRATRAIAALQVLDACKEGAYSALFPVLMLGVVGASATFMGIVNSSFAVTALVAGPAVAPIVRRYGYRSPIAAGASTAGLLLATLACLPYPSVALLTVLLAGFPFTVSWVACSALVLLSTRHGRRARTVGTLGSLYAATMLLSAAVAGMAAEHVGTVAVLLVAAALQVAAGPVFLVMTARGSRLDDGAI